MAQGRVIHGPVQGAFLEGRAMMVTTLTGWARAVANIFLDASADVGEWVIGIFRHPSVK